MTLEKEERGSWGGRRKRTPARPRQAPTRLPLAGLAPVDDHHEPANMPHEEKPRKSGGSPAAGGGSTSPRGRLGGSRRGDGGGSGSGAGIRWPSSLRRRRGGGDGDGDGDGSDPKGKAPACGDDDDGGDQRAGRHRTAANTDTNRRGRGDGGRKPSSPRRPAPAASSGRSLLGGGRQPVSPPRPAPAASAGAANRRKRKSPTCGADDGGNEEAERHRAASKDTNRRDHHLSSPECGRFFQNFQLDHVPFLKAEDLPEMPNFDDDYAFSGAKKKVV